MSTLMKNGYSIFAQSEYRIMKWYGLKVTIINILSCFFSYNLQAYKPIKNQPRLMTIFTLKNVSSAGGIDKMLSVV